MKEERVVLLVLAVTALAACGPPPAPQPGPESVGPPVATSPDTPVSPPATGEAPSASAPAPSTLPIGECRLPAPVKSQDACKTDADCGVSDPCHAHACVAISKARLPDKSTVCTMIMDCQSADRNPCVCFEGTCALVPPKE